MSAGKEPGMNERIDHTGDGVGGSMTDQINPDHYKRSLDSLGVEVIDILEAFFAQDPLLWQCGKYLLRAGHKDPLPQDLRKMIWYAERRIANEEKGNQE